MAKLNKIKFSSLYEMSSGLSSTPEQAGHGAPFLSFSGVFNNYFVPEILQESMNTSASEQETHSVRKGDIFLTRTSETLDELALSCVAIFDYPQATFSGFVKRLRPNTAKDVYPQFIGFYLRSELFRKTMSNNAVMTLRASFNEEIFSYLDLYLPDFDTQKRIGDLTYSIYSKIELNNKRNKILYDLAKKIYLYWFIQFDFPDENGKPYKSSGGVLEFNSSLKREIPVGWKDGLLGGSRISTALGSGIVSFDGEKKYLSTSEVNNSKIVNHHNNVNLTNKPSRANMQPERDTVWFAKMKNTRKNILVSDFSEELINDYIFSTGFAGVKALNNSLYYLWNFMCDENFEKIKDLRSVGTTQKAVNSDFLNQLKVLTPEQNILDKFHDLVQPIYEQIYINDRENLALSNLENWLLPILMNGQVKVK
jgi:type I restriction enzyme, S subunit